MEIVTGRHPILFGTIAAVVSFGLTLLVFFFAGWLSEDAYIVFRVVDNVGSGLGPVWNVGERVQVFTSPLWTGILSLCSALFRSRPPVTALGVSLVCSLMVTAAAVVMGSRRPLTLVLVLTWLFCSQSFLDYSTSGLENPLLHALAALMGLLLWLEPRLRPFRAVTGMSAACSLVLCTRLDAVFLAAPALACVAWRRRGELTMRQMVSAILAGQLPFLGWELFSLIYYGSFVPNTALAKLPLGYPRAELVKTGLVTIEASLVQDPGTVLCIVLVPIVLLLSRSRLGAMSLVSSAGTLAYIVLAGGDFMLGRFLSGIFVFSCVLLLAGSDDTLLRRSGTNPGSLARWGRRLIFSLVSLASILSLSWQFQKMKFAAGYDQQPMYKRQVADERSYYNLTGGVRAMRRGIVGSWLSDGEVLQENLKGQRALVAKRNVGMFCYAAGPDLFVIDLLSLGNGFLARLPACPSRRAGHFSRPMPAGYVSSLLEGRNRLKDPLLAKLFDDVMFATRAPLAARGRFPAIWRLNTGFYGDPGRMSAYARASGGVENVGVEAANKSVPCPTNVQDAGNTYFLSLAPPEAQDPPWLKRAYEAASGGHAAAPGADRR